MTRLSAYAAAWFAPSAMLAWILWASGQNPAAALAYGWTGVAGAAAYVVAHGLLERRRRRAEFDEDVAQAFLEAPRTSAAERELQRVPPGFCCEAGAVAFSDSCPWHDVDPPRLNDDIAITHEGLARLHADIRRDAERRPE